MKNKKLAFSLIEILIVVTIFGILATIAAQSTLISLRSARKSDSLADLRDNLDSTLSVMERNLRSAQSITTACTPLGSTGPLIRYIDEYENSAQFGCVSVTPTTDGFVASASGTVTTLGNAHRITSNQVDITACSITCTTPAGSSTPFIDIQLTGQNSSSSGLSGIDASSVTVDTRVNLRVY